MPAMIPQRFVQIAVTATHVYALDNYGQLWRLLISYPDATWENLPSEPWKAS